MPLTDVAIRNAKPRTKPYKMGDAGGLLLLVTPAGGKLWRLKFRVAGKEKLLSPGGSRYFLPLPRLAPGLRPRPILTARLRLTIA